MKTIIKVLLPGMIAFSASTFSLFAQMNEKGFYVGAGAGYSLASACGAAQGLANTGNTTPAAFENVTGSAGQGLSLALTPGYMFSKHIGAELGVSYLIGSPVTLTDNSNPS